MNRVLTIDRAKWRCGGSNKNSEQGYTQLLNDKDFMCCLGFDALACGYTKPQIIGRHYPSSLVIGPSKIAHLTDGSNDSIFASRAIEINDSCMSAEDREYELKAHYATIGVDVEFIGEYP